MRPNLHDFQRGELVKLAGSHGPWSGGTAVQVVSAGRERVVVRPGGGDPFELHHSELVRPRSGRIKPPRAGLVRV